MQAQVVNLLMDLQQQLKLTYLFIAHDLRLVEHICSRVAVMYLGKIVEMGPAASLFTAAQHPYTRALIAALPSLDTRGTLSGIPGLAPLLRDLPSGCAFHPRCPQAVERCRGEKPAVREVAGAHVACHLA